MNTTVVVRSYLDDVATTYQSGMFIKDVAPAPDGGEPNRLVYIRVNGKPHGKAEEFHSELNRDIKTTIERNDSCEIKYTVESWMVADHEENDHSPKRYTQFLTLELENLVTSHDPLVVLLSDDGQKWREERLVHGESRRVFVCRDIPPGQKAFVYRVLPPLTSEPSGTIPATSKIGAVTNA